MKISVSVGALFAAIFVAKTCEGFSVWSIIALLVAFPVQPLQAGE